MSENTDDAANESILYEVLEYFVRKQEPELTKHKNDTVAFPTSGTIKNALRYLNNRYSLPESISEQISNTLPWKFAIGNKGRILAILQENIIEIRKAKDEYSSLIGRASAPKDLFPQWRMLAWSPDGSILALASSSGYISFYNSFGNNIYNISPKSLSQNSQILEAGDAIASMIFKKPRVRSDNWDYEFISVTYSGLLKSYCICSSEFSENHEFSFGNFYRDGVNSVSYSAKHNLFFVAGNSVSQNFTFTALQTGLTCWRTLNDHPYYKLSNETQDMEVYRPNFSIWNFIPVMKNRAQSLIFKTSISPNEQLISCIHTDGTVSIWTIPSLRLQNQWKLQEQPNHDAINPLKNSKFKKTWTNISEFQPLDIGWWSNNAVIISRYSGSVSVCSISNLGNLLGTNPEFLYSYPQIAELDEAKGFLCLDCEVITGTKRNRESRSEGNVSEISSDSEKDEDDSKPVTVLNYTTNLMKSALYSITEHEKFQPKRKRSRVFQRTYRLLGIKSTTPEELYSRKIEIQEYEEALSLAKTYNLDPDLVYQTQWRKSEFSIEAVQEHLSKVSKRSWVLNECVSRVPETLEATRELLNFGLRGANVETLVALRAKDDGKFTSTEVDEADDDLDENTLQLKKMQKINQTLESISIGDLNESQKELIKYRKKLLDHLDKLQTYEILLESTNKFNKRFYEEFRQLSPLENAVRFAKKGHIRGVEIMFTYYGAKLIPHWLIIISYFPETLNPEKYQKLLPECDIEGRLFLLYQQELRQKDWVERSIFSEIVDSDSYDDTNSIYENKRSLMTYRNKEITPDLLLKWYKERAYEIERDSRLVDNALTLVNIGKSHNVNGLENLVFELETLDDLVYKVGLEDLTLAEVEKLDDLDKIKLLMSKSDENNFVINIKNIVLPYLRRKKRYSVNKSESDLLHDYLVFLSRDDLTLPVKFFESLKFSYDPEILDVIKSITELAIDCIYASNDLEMFPKAKAIFEVSVSHISGREDVSEKYQELEKELKALQLLNKYEIKVPLHHIKVSRDSQLEAKLLLNQMSENLINVYVSPNEKNWTNLLNDMLDIQESAFTCLDIETCFEIAMITRLKSGLKPAIQGCVNLMEVKKTGRSHLKVSYERALDLILQASNEYFNNSKSLTDPDMELAKECLQLIPEDEKIKEEYDLIESLQILHEFNIDLLPMQVRMMQDRLQLIENCLDNRHDAYKSKQKLLNLSKYLRIESKNNRLREGKVLNLIAKKSLKVKDFNFCSSIIQQLIKMNYQSAWDVAFNLACCDDYNDLKIRKNCIWFTINNGPSDMIENFMKRANLLHIQILNSELEKWIPTENKNMEENSNMDIDLNNVLHSPSAENREFVPKIVQTSTDLVKSSAKMVKQSTFDLIKNASNTNFWKSKFSFNVAEKSPKIIEENEIIKKEKSRYLQKFPCFYESLHDNCGISSLDTEYSKYSQTEYNNKLKLCQTLLRISLLSETASYGAEISDINHLLLECAEHTIPEDCTLGLSYLLSMNDNTLETILETFENLPQDEMYSQILAYLCSIKLYSKLHDEHDKIFLMNPISLIHHMSNVKTKDMNDEQKKLKELINQLIEAKKEKSNIGSGVESRVMYDSKCSIDEPMDIDSNEIKKEKSIKEISVDKEKDEWDNWGDEWADVSSHTELEKDLNVEKHNNNKTETAPKRDSIIEVEGNVYLEETKEADGVDEWNNWGDEWADVNTSSSEEKSKMDSEKKHVTNESAALESNPCNVAEKEEDEPIIDIVAEKKDEPIIDSIAEKEDEPIIDSATEKENEPIIDSVPEKEDEPIIDSVPEKEDEPIIDSVIVSDGWDEWGNEWTDDVPSTSSCQIVDKENDLLECSSVADEYLPEEKRSEFLEQELSKLESMSDYNRIKQLLFKWPDMNDLSSSHDASTNIALRLFEKIINMTTDSNSRNEILYDMKDFICQGLIPQEVFIEFINMRKDHFDPELYIYLQLCSKEPSLQQKSINYIKDNYKKLSLDTLILEEIFFNNLTSSFGVSHELYYKILEEVFTNRTLVEIEDNVKLLIHNLTEQKNIPHAIALLNQLEGIPSALSTYENCFQLLLRK